MRTRLIHHKPLGISPHQKGNAASPNVSWTCNSFYAGYRTVTACWDFPLKQLTGSPTILYEKFFTERMKGCVFQLKHLNKMPRQSTQCCQQVEGKVLLIRKHLVPRKTLTRFSSLICLDCPTLASAAMTKTSCSKIPCCLCTEINQDQLKANNLRSLIHVQEEKKPSLPDTHSTWAKGKTFVMGRHRTYLTGVLTVQDCQFHRSDLKCHKILWFVTTQEHFEWKAA